MNDLNDISTAIRDLPRTARGLLDRLREHPLLDVFYPPHCVICGDRLACHAPLCVECATLLCNGYRKMLSRKVLCNARYAYEDDVRRGILRMKFTPGQEWAAWAFGKLLAISIASWYHSSDINFVAYVPISKNGYYKRGFDQCAVLATAVSEHTGLPVRHVLHKRDVEKQSRLPAPQRVINVKGAYSVTTNVDGARILLIDDICTTGSTLGECVGLLYDSGAAEVRCAVLALTPQHRDVNTT